MKSFRTLFPVVGVVMVLAGCSGSETTNTGATGAASSPVRATSDKTEGANDNGRAKPGFPHHGGPELLVFAALHENINLTAEQRTTIEGLIEKGHGPHAGQPGAHPAPDRAKIAELAAAVRSGNVDTSELALAPSPEVQSFMKERQAKMAEKLATLHETLTKEQRSALVDAITAKMAQRPERRPEGGPEGRPEGGPMGHLLAGLDLTQAQKDQIKAKLDADRPARPSEADFSAMKTSMDAKLQSFKVDTFDASAFAAPPANAPKMGSPAEHMAKELSAVVSVLTPAQRESLAQKIEQGPLARQ